MSAFLVQRGQRTGAAALRPGDEAFPGVSCPSDTAARAAVADEVVPPFAAGGDVSVTAVALLPPLFLVPIWAADAVIGFPQSMQNREVASFSRPQNEQTVNRQPPAGEILMAREYRSAYREGQ